MFKFYNIIIITLLRIYVEYTVFLPPFTSSSFGGQRIRCVKRVAGIQSSATISVTCTHGNGCTSVNASGHAIPSCIRVLLTGIIVFLKNIRLGASTPSHALQRVLCQGQFPSAFTSLSNSFGSRFFLLTLRKEDERCSENADDGAAESGKRKIACVEG